MVLRRFQAVEAISDGLCHILCLAQRGVRGRGREQLRRDGQVLQVERRRARHRAEERGERADERLLLPGEVDGAGTFWFGNNGVASAQTGIWFLPAGSTAATGTRLRPCYVPAGSTTCDATLIVSGSQYYTYGDVQALQVDSAGSVWVAAGSTVSSNTGFVLEVLGTGAPTWPLYALGSFATKPQ